MELSSNEASNLLRQLPPSPEFRTRKTKKTMTDGCWSENTRDSKSSAYTMLNSQRKTQRWTWKTTKVLLQSTPNVHNNKKNTQRNRKWVAALLIRKIWSSLLSRPMSILNGDKSKERVGLTSWRLRCFLFALLNDFHRFLCNWKCEKKMETRNSKRTWLRKVRNGEVGWRMRERERERGGGEGDRDSEKERERERGGGVGRERERWNLRGKRCVLTVWTDTTLIQIHQPTIHTGNHLFLDLLQHGLLAQVSIES